MLVENRIGGFALADGDKLVRYITEQVVTYLETPGRNRRNSGKYRERWAYRWFGLVPFAFGHWIRRIRRMRRKRQEQK